MVGMLLVTGAFADPAAPFRLGVWELAGFASSILSGAAVAAIRAARRTEGSWAIYGSFTLFGLVVTAPFALADFRWPTAAEWALLALVGAASIAAQLAMTYAYRWVTNLQAGALAQLTVVVTMALGVLFLGDSFGPSQLVGAAARPRRHRRSRLAPVRAARGRVSPSDAGAARRGRSCRGGCGAARRRSGRCAAP